VLGDGLATDPPASLAARLETGRATGWATARSAASGRSARGGVLRCARRRGRVRSSPDCTPPRRSSASRLDLRPTAPWRDDTERSLASFVAADALPSRIARALRQDLARTDPGEARFGLVHTDLCGENIVIDRAGPCTCRQRAPRDRRARLRPRPRLVPLAARAATLADLPLGVRPPRHASFAATRARRAVKTTKRSRASRSGASSRS
jgi:hypothetical protein